MNVEDKEINGFAIDKFNQHGLEVGKTQGVCPWSSECRKPENQKKKCSSYDWERGCLLYTSPSPRDVEESRMPSSA